LIYLYFIFFFKRRGLVNIRWYEYTFLILGILAALVTDGLTIARLVKIRTLSEPDFAYGILILVHSGINEIFRKKIFLKFSFCFPVFLLLFLITGIFYQRITDIVAFFISAVMLTIYVIAHYFARRNGPDNDRNTQSEIRLVNRRIFKIKS